MTGLSDSLTFFQAISEGAGVAHGATLLLQRHGRVPQARVTVRVAWTVLIGQAVDGAQGGHVDLGGRALAESCGEEEHQERVA